MDLNNDFQELICRCNEIDALIDEQVVSGNENSIRILDGIVDVEKYYKAKYKIMWILKEPYDEGDGTGGDWDLREVVKSKNTIYDFASGRQTFRPMIYASWGILNEFCLYDDMEFVEKDPSMLNALKSVAYINVKKLPGFTASVNSIISQAYNKYKDILLKQMEVYDADIIIGGSTLHNFLGDLGIEKNKMIKYGSLNYSIKEGTVYMDAYHPSQRPSSTGVLAEQYCNDIINIAKIFAQSATPP